MLISQRICPKLIFCSESKCICLLIFFIFLFQQSQIDKKKKSIIICFLIISVICIGIAAYVAYYLYMSKPIRPVKNYTLHANSYLQKHGLKKENFEGPIKEIYLDDFLDYSTDKDCANHNQVNIFLERVIQIHENSNLREFHLTIMFVRMLKFTRILVSIFCHTIMLPTKVFSNVLFKI